MDECDNHKQIVLKQSSVADKSNKGDLSWANGNLKIIVNTYYSINLCDLVRTMKSYTTYHIWKKYHTYLSKFFWKEHTFWTDGYFVCSVGNVSEKILKEYIEKQW
ncbi:MAG: transposase [Lachnospiraceae bacterium]|uniref:transposase n=1 Tax=Falcatimonas sp. MSJ-15 TaxID=2841515 RepID=UPI001C0F9A4B|nr:transposase [Falcatimonas sp. MSJ-15]MEE0960278.1 transposase [Lachnospiraceae bacterium]